MQQSEIRVFLQMRLVKIENIFDVNFFKAQVICVTWQRVDSAQIFRSKILHLAIVGRIVAEEFACCGIPKFSAQMIAIAPIFRPICPLPYSFGLWG